MAQSPLAARQRRYQPPVRRWRTWQCEEHEFVELDHNELRRLLLDRACSRERKDSLLLALVRRARVDVDAATRVLAESRPAVTFLCSPNNPTGLVEPEANVRALLEHVPGLLVVDEAYGQFAPWSALSLVDEDRPIVVTRTFSKTWSMAAARLGYLVGPRWLVDELEKVALPYHLDATKQIGGRLAQRGETQHGKFPRREPRLPRHEPGICREDLLEPQRGIVRREEDNRPAFPLAAAAQQFW